MLYGASKRTVHGIGMRARVCGRDAFEWGYAGIPLVVLRALCDTPYSTRTACCFARRNLVGQRLISQTLPRSPYCMEGSVHHWKVAEAPLGLLMNHTIRRVVPRTTPRHAHPPTGCRLRSRDPEKRTAMEGRNVRFSAACPPGIPDTVVSGHYAPAEISTKARRVRYRRTSVSTA